MSVFPRTGEDILGAGNAQFQTPHRYLLGPGVAEKSQGAGCYLPVLRRWSPDPGTLLQQPNSDSSCLREAVSEYQVQGYLAQSSGFSVPRVFCLYECRSPVPGVLHSNNQNSDSSHVPEGSL